MREVFLLEKFPVISPKGNTYHVVIGDDNSFGILYCSLYVEGTGCFGRKKLREVYSGADLQRRFGVNYREFAESTVLRYERKLDQEAEEKRNHELSVEAFEAWDGKVGADG